MKYFLLFFLLIFLHQALLAQAPDTISAVTDTAIQQQPIAPGQLRDSNQVKSDSLAPIAIAVKRVPELLPLLGKNTYLNINGAPVSLAVRPRKANGNDLIFYAMAGLVLLLGIARSVYGKYFSNMFRVFFNSSLRQSQITDQLVQDQLPSLIFNLFFVITGGFYFYLLLEFFHLDNTAIDWGLLSICVLAFAVVYLVKFISLKFTGWITGFSQEANIYTFIIFLINKILGILLLPIVIVLAFAEKQIANGFVWLSFIVIGIMLLMRFFRSYGLLQYRIKVSRFHFFLYIFSLEILPLLIIYKGVMIFFNISL